MSRKLLIDVEVVGDHKDVADVYQAIRKVLDEKMPLNGIRSSVRILVNGQERLTMVGEISPSSDA